MINHQLVAVSSCARFGAITGRAEIKVSSIPRCKQRGVNSLQDDRCLQSVGFCSFLCRFSPVDFPSGIAAVPCNGNLTQQFGNRGMRPVLTFFVKINRAVAGTALYPRSGAQS